MINISDNAKKEDADAEADKVLEELLGKPKKEIRRRELIFLNLRLGITAHLQYTKYVKRAT